ncbi:MAG TPA: hypothetical protein H9974_08530 [Candidatus Dorea intestinigallinarum]|nr:hypothetical protein [Candidatus Dorea intestinigallinarum]
MAWQKGTSGNPRGRPRHNEIEKQNKENFEQELKKYSSEALETIVELIHSPLNHSLRFKASVWVLEHIYGKDFHIEDLAGAQATGQNVTINVIPIGSDFEITEEDAELIRRAEAGEQMVDLPGPDEEGWDVGEEWGTDTYDPE